MNKKKDLDLALTAKIVIMMSKKEKKRFAELALKSGTTESALGRILIKNFLRENKEN